MPPNRAHLGPILPILLREGLTVLSQEEGYIACPGEHLHTAPTGDSDCIVFNNDVAPFIYCLHASCEELRREKNHRLFAATCKQGRSRSLSLRSPLYKGSSRASAKNTKAEDEAVMAEMQEQWSWPYAAIQSDQRGMVATPQYEHWRLILGLYDPDEIVWIGRDIYDSGKVGHKWRFRPAGEWLRRSDCPGTFICPNSFKPGVYSRSNENVLATKYLVVESDHLSRDQVGAVFRWMEELSPKLRLKAVVDTAGKSLHGWFDYPSPELLADLRDVLPRLKCDASMFKPSQPCRLPGALRNGKYQRLIYFAL